MANDKTGLYFTSVLHAPFTSSRLLPSISDFMNRGEILYSSTILSRDLLSTEISSYFPASLNNDKPAEPVSANRTFLLLPFDEMPACIISYLSGVILFLVRLIIYFSIDLDDSSIEYIFLY